jgi:putative transposase
MWRRRCRGSAPPTPSLSDDDKAPQPGDSGSNRWAGRNTRPPSLNHRISDHGLVVVLSAVVHPADVHDREGGKLVLNTLGERFPRFQHLWADQGYTTFRTWAHAQTGIEVEVVGPWRQLKRYDPELLERLGYQPGFNVLPRRWVVERTFSWLGRYRRLSKDYERLPATSEALVYLAGIRLLLRRLT